MNLFTKIKNSLLETRRPIIKTIIGSIVVIGGSIGVVALTSNTTPDKKPTDNDNLIVEDVTEGDTKTVIFDELEFDQVTADETTVTTIKVTTSTAKTCTTTTVINTTASTTPTETKKAPQPAPAAVTPAVDDGTVATTVVKNDTATTATETSVATTIESTTASEPTTTTAEVVEPNENNEYIVYKPSTHYVHRNTCHWYTDECVAITTTEGLECRICTECNPDITVVTPYVETPAANAVNTSGHAALNYVTEEERIYLCNTVAQEYGSDWVSIYDKASVVATVMNRVRDGGWTNGLPSTVYNVLTAPYQYNPAYAVPYYRSNVTQSCVDAVDYYFDHQNEFPNWHSFYGDGVRNYFR